MTKLGERTMTKLAVKTTVQVPMQRIWDALINGFEGGVGYWAQIVDYRTPPNLTFRGDTEHVYKYADYPLNAGGAVVLGDATGEGGGPGTPWILDLAAIERGLATLGEKHPTRLAEILEENDDAETADVFIQVCLFGEIVFG